MQLGFSKQISESLIEDFFSLIILNLKRENKLKISKFGTFSIRKKKSRIGRNPKTKEKKKNFRKKCCFIQTVKRI